MIRSISSFFRKYHRQLAILTLLPILLVTLTGMMIPIFEELHLEGLPELMTKVHSGAVFGSDLVYSVLVGLGLLGLIVTGFTMTGLMPGKRFSSNDVDDGNLSLEDLE